MSSIHEFTVNTLRLLSVEGVEKAKSGHPGLPMGAAPIAYTLWSKHLKHTSNQPEWLDRDRFVLSAGHGSMLLYSLLHLFGYAVSLEDLQNFRQLHSITPGHPEFGMTQGVEATTGPLGQGISNAVGMAMAERFLANHFNREGYAVIDHYTYALVGDGCLQEGVSYEAASIAGSLGLGKLIMLFDSNGITIEGATSLAFHEDVQMRFESMHWHVQTVADGNDIAAVDQAIAQAKAVTDKPSLIRIQTQIGYGCPKRVGSEKAHGEPLGEENIKETKAFLNWPHDAAFTVPQEVKQHLEEIQQSLDLQYEAWENLWMRYAETYPQEAQALQQWLGQDFNLDALKLEDFVSASPKEVATRVCGGEILNKLAAVVPNLLGGSADLNPSTKTYLNGKADFSRAAPGHNVHFGIREHAMGAIANGIAYHGGLRPYASTFFVFSDYMKPAIRLSALSSLPVLYIFTHDSIGVGEDGPTHQPIEHLAALRAIPNLVTYRPADETETFVGYLSAMTEKSKPYAMVLTRQNLPPIASSSMEAAKGAYVILGDAQETPDIILMASGSEVHLVYAAGQALQAKGSKVRVLSVPSMELFQAQAAAYQEKILPKAVTKRMAVEAGASMPWYRYVGLDGCVLGIDRFGESAPAKKVFEALGFTVENIVAKAEALLQE